MRKKIKWSCYISIVLLIFFLPHCVQIVRFHSVIFTTIEEVDSHDYGVVFGAYVRDDATLTDVTFERIEAAVLLYQHQKIQRLFISGDNGSNQQVDVMAEYAISRGVAKDHIITDYLGIDTHDTCWHFADIAKRGVLITQGYHLPRSLYFCESENIYASGLAVNHLDLLTSRGDNLLSVYAIRTWRFVREAGLTWLFMLGLYDKISNEAESMNAMP